MCVGVDRRKEFAKSHEVSESLHAQQNSTLPDIECEPCWLPFMFVSQLSIAADSAVFPHDNNADILRCFS